MLNRSIFCYLILIIILLRMDFDIVHGYRAKHLDSIYYLGHIRNIDKNGGSQKDVIAGIVYFDYLRRINPENAKAWEGLINSYISAHHLTKARETLATALHKVPEHSVNYPKLLALANRLNEQPPAK